MANNQHEERKNGVSSEFNLLNVLLCLLYFYTTLAFELEMSMYWEFPWYGNRQASFIGMGMGMGMGMP